MAMCFKPSYAYPSTCRLWVTHYMVQQKSGTHGGKCISIEAAAVNTLMIVQQFQCPGFKFQIINDQNEFSWGADDNYTTKFNCDASWIPSSRKTAFGCVAFCKNGSVYGVRAGLLPCANSATEAEGMALLQALLWALKDSLEKCLFMIDRNTVFQNLTSSCKSNLSDLQSIFICARMMVQKQRWKIRVINRADNSIADKMAKKDEDLYDFYSQIIPVDCFEENV